MVEATLTIALAATGMQADTAVAAVLVYRFLNLLAPVTVGYLLLAASPRPRPAHATLQELRSPASDESVGRASASPALR
ncbi:hypothetical protein JGU72_20140 [Antrihabitans sp. YC2-6]|nr:hypothetical protein [Antrihabitans sp. YC2-6]